MVSCCETIDQEERLVYTVIWSQQEMCSVSFCHFSGAAWLFLKLVSSWVAQIIWTTCSTLVWFLWVIKKPYYRKVCSEVNLATLILYHFPKLSNQVIICPCQNFSLEMLDSDHGWLISSRLSLLLVHMHDKVTDLKMFCDCCAFFEVQGKLTKSVTMQLLFCLQIAVKICQATSFYRQF